jgi:hypothetical protein
LHALTVRDDLIGRPFATIVDWEAGHKKFKSWMSADVESLRKRRMLRAIDPRDLHAPLELTCSFDKLGLEPP